MRTAIAPLGPVPGIVRSSVVASLVLACALFLQSAQPAHAADREVSNPGMCSGTTSPFTCRFSTTLYVSENSPNGLYWHPLTITASSGLMISDIVINTTYTRDGSYPEDCLFDVGEPAATVLVDPYNCLTEPNYQWSGGGGQSGEKHVEIDVTFISSRAETAPTCFLVDDEINRRLRTRVLSPIQIYGSGYPITTLYCDPSFAVPSPVIATTTTVTFGTGPFIYSANAFTATATVSPPEAGTPTIAYTGDCMNVGTTCTATATFAATSTHAGSVSDPANITITYVTCAPAKGDDDRDDRGGDKVKRHEAGSTIAVKVRICDAGGRNIGSRTLQVQAVGVSPSGTLASAGRSNPDNLFRLDGRTYGFNLNTKGLAPGAHTLDYVVGNDPTTYHYDFMIRAGEGQ